MDAYGKVEGVGEIDGPVHWIYRTVSNVEQGGRVVKAQVPRTDEGKCLFSWDQDNRYVCNDNEQTNKKK